MGLDQQLSDAVDQVVIMNLFVEHAGWTKGKLRETGMDPVLIDQWCTEYLEGLHLSYFEEYVFESERDAVLFALRWS